MGDAEHTGSALVSWLVVIILALFVIVNGLFSFFMVGRTPPDDWDYRPVKDVPGQSLNAVYPTLPYKQHVRGREGK